MNPEQKLVLKTNIEKLLNQLQKQLKLVQDNSKPISPENSIGRVSRMDAINNKGVSDMVLKSTKSKINALHAALKKIDLPGFGLCENCNNMIQYKRLVFLPESKSCVKCAR